MRVFLAIVFSVGFHCATAFLVSMVLSGVTDDSASVEVTLDLSQVELSFAEDDDASAQAVPMPSADEKRADVPRDFSAPKVDAADEIPQPLPPVIGAVELPSAPELPPPKMDLPPEREKESRSSLESSAAPRQARIDVPPKPRRAITPKYPLSSRKNREEGTVALSLMIDERGTVTSADIERSSGFPALDAAAKEAVLSARFNPAKSGSRNVSSSARISLRFTLK